MANPAIRIHALPNGRELRQLADGCWECQPANDNTWSTAATAAESLADAGWTLELNDLADITVTALPPTINLDALADLAGQAAAVQSDLDGAAAAERTAGIALLTAILAKCKPGLSSICSRPLLSERGGNDSLKSWGCGDSTSRATWKGICIAGDDSEVREGCRDDNRGDIAGCGLWLSPDLTLAEIAYSGSWSRWQGEGSEWETTVEIYDDLDTAVAGGWKLDPEDVATGLAEAFQAVTSGKGPGRAKAMAARAERLAAVAALVS